MSLSAVSRGGQRVGIAAALRNWSALQVLIVLVCARLEQWTRRRHLGFWWWLIEPIAMTITYFGLVLFVFHWHRPHMVLFLLCGVLSWSWFTSAVGLAQSSLTRQGRILKSVPIDLHLLPLSDVVAVTIKCAACIPIVVVVMAYYRIVPTVHILWLPLLLFVQLTLTIGISFWLAWARVYAEDVESIWRILTRVLFMLSAGIYAIDQLPDSIQPWFLLNPFATLITSYRSVVIDGASPPLVFVLWSFICGAVLTASGLAMLRRCRRTAVFLV